MFSEKKEDDQPPKGFEKFYKKKEGSSDVKKEDKE
jgi:hypothetical protein